MVEEGAGAGAAFVSGAAEGAGAELVSGADELGGGTGPMSVFVSAAGAGVEFAGSEAVRTAP